MKKGFTLIEVLVVLAIIFILTMLLLPLILQARNQAYLSNAPPKVGVYRCVKSYLETVENNAYVRSRYFAGLEDNDHVFKTFEFKQDSRCVKDFRDLFSQLETNKYYEVTSVDGFDYPIVTNLKEAPKKGSE